MGQVESALDAQRPTSRAQFRSKPVIAFIGTALDFPNTNLEFVREELDGLLVARYESLRELKAACQAENLRVHVLILPDNRVNDLIERKDVYEAAVGDGRLALAYQTLDAAEKLCREEIALHVSFMPIHCPVDVWTAFVRLICYGQEVIPAELFKVAPSRNENSEATRAVQSGSHQTKLANLTTRETQILELVAQGLKNREIGSTLGLSEHTVKLHLHNTFAKLGVSNRASAAAYFLYRTGHGSE